MARWRLVVLAVGVGLAVVAGVAMASSSAPRSDEPSRAELYRLQDRINAQWDALAREGIYVRSTGHPAEPCVAIGLANPTRPNVRYLERRFGPNVCVEREPEGQAYACGGALNRPVAVGPIRVPDVRDLGVEEASRRLLAQGLTFAISCLGDAKRKVERPARHSPEQLMRVTKQCPRPGELVPEGAEVALAAKAILPGGFKAELSALTGYHTGTSTPCADGRNPAPASNSP